MGQMGESENMEPMGNVNKFIGPETWFLVLGRSPYREGAFERIGFGVWDGNFREKSPYPLFSTASYRN